MAVLLSVSVLAYGTRYIPYEGYDINNYDESVAAPAAYYPKNYISSKDMGLEISLVAPSDMQYTDEGLYILDGGNSRIILLDEKYKVKKIFEDFKDSNGNEVTFSEAKGFYVVAENNFVIADTGNLRILVIKDGIVTQIIERPESALLDTDSAFIVNKVIVNDDGDIYALAESINLGAFVFKPNGEFSHFFASNNVEVTATVILNNILKKVLTKEQIAGLAQATPVNINNFDIDENGMIYTVTEGSGTKATAGMVKCLNYKGSNILSDSIVFGDVETDDLIWSDSLTTKFSDIDIDESGFINLLDTGRRKVFQYTKKGKLVGVFGAAGSKVGMFDNPVAIESVESDTIVLDSSLGTITVFSPTKYGSLMRNGYTAMLDSNIEESFEIWNEVLKLNTNSNNAYYGIGMVYDSRGEYAEAMHYFKLADAKPEYSKAYREYRKEWINQNYIFLIAGVLIIIVTIKLVSVFIGKKMTATNQDGYSVMESKYTFPIYTLIHPADGFEQFKWRSELPSTLICVGVALLLFVIKSLRFFYDGFSFNSYRPVDYNIVVTFLSTIGLYVFFVIGNWAVASLTDGKGTLKQIAAVTAYSLIPFLVSSLIQLMLTQVLTAEETAIITLISAIGIIWSALLMFIGLMQIHQYSTLKNIGSIILTVVSISILALLCILLYTLVCQTVNFFVTIFSELKLR